MSTSAVPQSDPVFSGVVLTRDLEASADAYGDLPGLCVGERFRLTVAQARTWLAPDLAGAAARLVVSATQQPVLVLVDSPGARAANPFRQAGWFALSMQLQDLQAVRASAVCFTELPGPLSTQLSLRGPGDEVLFLHQQEGPGGCEVTTAVANVPDVQSAVDSYQTVLCDNVRRQTRPLCHINREWGFGAARRHPVAELPVGDRQALQLNELRAARIPASSERFTGLFMVCTGDPLRTGAQVYKGTAGERLLI